MITESKIVNQEFEKYKQLYKKYQEFANTRYNRIRYSSRRRFSLPGICYGRMRLQKRIMKQNSIANVKRAEIPPSYCLIIIMAFTCYDFQYACPDPVYQSI